MQASLESGVPIVNSRRLSYQHRLTLGAGHGRPVFRIGCAVCVMKDPGLVIFDCDGVLVDSEVIACRTDSICLAEMGILISIDEVLDRYLGRSAASMIADIETRFGRRLPGDFAATLHARTQAAFAAELKPMPGVREVLALSRMPTCVASSSAPERLRASLRLAGLLQFFEPHVFSATQVGRGKPAPDLFLLAATKMRVEPGRCLVVEDSSAGVEAAVAAGMAVLGFVGGSHCGSGHAERLRSAGAQTIFSDMRELPSMLGGSVA